jgi:hypothetical protein
MDVKKKVEEVVAKLKANPSALATFKDDPIKAIESLSGIDIPDEIEDKVVAGVKAALAGDKASGIIDSVKKLF